MYQMQSASCGAIGKGYFFITTIKGNGMCNHFNKNKCICCSVRYAGSLKRSSLNKKRVGRAKKGLRTPSFLMSVNIFTYSALIRKFNIRG